MSLLCAAAFVLVMDRYNVLYACLTIAGFWLIVTLALFSIYVLNRRRAAQVAMAARAARPSMLADPLVIATGVQIVQAIGIKRVAALAAVAGARWRWRRNRRRAIDAKRRTNRSPRPAACWEAADITLLCGCSRMVDGGLTHPSFAVDGAPRGSRSTA